LRVCGIAFHELEACFLLRKRGRADIYAKHVAEPQVLADALMNHVFMDAPAPRIAGTRAEEQILVQEFTPDADHLEPFGGIGLDQEVVNHKPPH
jgi:hypothetical protein